jgi:hypothetical protein
MELNPIIVNTDSPSNDELLVGMGSEQTAGNMAFIRREGRNRKLRFAKRTGNDRRPFTDADIDPGSVVSMAIGTPDLPPTSGTFGFSYNGVGVGDGTLDYNISAAALETALNANIEIGIAGGVTVQSATPGSWIVTFNLANPRFPFVEYANVLIPISQVNFTTIQEGGSVTQQITLITLRQNYLAFSNDFAPGSAGSIAAEHVQTGDATKPDVYRIAISGDPNGGSWLLTSTQAQTLLISPQANSDPSSFAKWYFDGFVTPTAADYTNIVGTYVDLEDEVGPVRFYARVNGAGPVPPAPAGGRIVSVPITDPNPDSTNLTDAQYIAHAYYVGIIADSKFDGTATQNSLQDFAVIAATPGQRSIAAKFAGYFTVRLDQTAGDGPYQSTYFAFGDSHGSVAAWFNVAARGVRPAEVDAFARVIEVTTVTAGMSAAGVGGALQTLLDADAEFVATLSGSQVTVAQAFAGPRDAASNGTAPLGIVQTREGRTIASVFPWDASAGQIQQFIGTAYSVSGDTAGTWDLIGVENGAGAALTVNGDGLTFAATWEGTFILSTVNLFLAFAALPAGTSITSKFEIQVVEPGQQPAKVYQGDCEIRADVIDANNLVTPGAPNPTNNITFLPSVTALTGGGASKLDGVTTAGVTVPRMYAFRDSVGQIQFYALIAGTAAEESPFVIRPDDYAGGSNEKVFTACSLGAPVVVADATARNARAPQFIGQLLFQTDTGQYYRADGVAAGEWTSAIQLDGLLLAGDLTHASQLFAQAGVSPSITLPATSGTLALDALTSYTVAGVPSAAANARKSIWVSNESGGAFAAISDGTNWRRYTDRAIIS